MSRKPRSSNSHIFSDGLGINLLWQGTVITILTLASFVIGYRSQGQNAAMTMAFITLCVCEMLHAWNMRSLKGSIFTMKKHNIVLIGAIALSAVLTIPVLFIPSLRTMFSLEALTGSNYLWAFLAGACIVPIVEIVKFFQRAADKK